MWLVDTAHHNLCSETAPSHDDAVAPSPWLAGIQLSSFPGSYAARVAKAAHSLGADILSPSAESFISPSPDPSLPGYTPFTTGEMVREAQRLGMRVKPWTVRISSATAIGRRVDRRAG